MKKAVITILMALPFVLIVIISLAGIILSEYAHIAVEDVAFISAEGELIDRLSIGKDEETSLIVQVYPKLASNKEVRFSSAKPEVCSVDDKGRIRGLDYGTAVITVFTVENRKTAVLEVKVSDSPLPTRVELSKTEAELKIRESITLVASVFPVTAANKAVSWASDDPTVVSVDQNGKITGLKEGSAVITVTTRENGLTAQCTVTVIAEQAPLKWADYDEGKSVYEVSEATVDLFTLIFYDDTLIAKGDIVFSITSGSANGTLDSGSILTFKTKGIIRLKATAKQYSAEILIRQISI